MSFETAGYQLQPVLPELVLAVGSMALLMLGAYRGQGTTRLVTGLSVCLLLVTGILELTLPSGKLSTFGGSPRLSPARPTPSPGFRNLALFIDRDWRAAIRKNDSFGGAFC